MRAAVILGKVAVPPLARMPPEKDMDVLVDLVKNYPPCQAAHSALTAIYDDIYDVGVYATMWIGPHIDDIGEITLGIVIRGDHYLFTGNGRRVGDLTPGTVFALLNKKTHGAYPRDRKNVTPLIFAACEPKVPIWDWRKFCAEVSEKLANRLFCSGKVECPSTPFPELLTNR